jgi:DNA repair exonuclease SbcCD ATPase subunit
MKTLLPWLCVLGLAIGLGLVYSASQKKDAELAALREESQQLQQLRAELEATNSVRPQAQSDELTRLRKDNEDLLRLRNEVGQLRKDKQQLAAQVQTAQAQAQGAQAQVQAQRANPAQAPAPGPLDPAAQAAFAARYGVTPQTPEQQQAAVCLNNLRQIEGAKQQWALEKQKPSGALLTATDLAPYLKTNVLPTCPAGGVYTINPVGYAPLCNIPGHALGK